MKLPQSKEEKNKLLKKIYDYCIKVNWQKTKLDELARELGTTRTELRNLAKRYAKKILDTKAYENLCQQVDEIVDFEKKDTKTKLPILNPILLDKIGKETYLLWETKEEKELVLKYIYDYCIKVKWDKNELEKLAKKLGITVIRLKEHAKKYVKGYLPSEAYELVKQQINEAATSKRELKKLTIPIINPILLEKFGKTTYLLWENEEEKELILKFIYEYCNKYNFSNKSIEQLSKLLGISPYRINKCYQEYTFKYLKLTKEEYHKKRNEYAQRKRSKNIPKTKQTNESLTSLEKQKSPKSLWENEEEKESVLKYIYEYCNNLNWDNNELEKLAKKLCITVAEVKRLAKKYIEEYLPRKKYHPLEEQTNETTTSKQLFEERKLSIINPILLQILGKRTYFLWENEEEKKLVLKYIYEYCDKFKFDNSNIEYLSNWLGISKDIINEYCKEYALTYLKWTKEQYFRKRCESLPSDNQQTESKNHDISLNKSQEQEILEIITTPYIPQKERQLRVKIYPDYPPTQKPPKEPNSFSTPNTPDAIKQIVEYIKLGIVENGVTRPFDIIDYYLIIKTPLNTILGTTKEQITNEEYVLLRAFVHDNKDTLINEPHIEKELSNDEEKNTIIIFLRNNNIPLNRKTYNIASRRYINGTLDLKIKHRK